MDDAQRVPAEETRALAGAETRVLMGEVSRRPVRELIAEKLAALISSGVLAPGDELPGERELATSLSVSRETVRGAIGILAAHGILRVAHGARTAVATADVSSLSVGAPTLGFDGPYDLDSVHRARLLIERDLAATAALQITPRDLERLEASIAAQRACDGDPIRFLLCDRDFHATLYRAGGNPVLSDMAMALYNHLLDHRRRIVAQPGAVAESVADHTAVLDALRAGDPEETVKAVTTHATRIFVTTSAFLAART